MNAGAMQPLEFTEQAQLQAVANRLRQVADRQGVSQKQLAERLGVSASAINKIFKNPERSKVATLRKVAEALGVHLHDII